MERVDRQLALLSFVVLLLAASCSNQPLQRAATAHSHPERKNVPKIPSHEQNGRYTGYTMDENISKMIGQDVGELVGLIHQCPVPYVAHNRDPAALIRAVNALHALGAENAGYVLLHYYCELGCGGDFEDSFNAKLRALLLLQLLFVPKDSTSWRAPLGFGASILWPPDGYKSWPLFPVALVDDIPFIFDVDINISGALPFLADEVSYCRLNCRLREKPLRPTGSPLAAADKLTNSKRWKALFRDVKEHQHVEMRNVFCVRKQALTCLSEFYDVNESTIFSDQTAWTLPQQVDREWERLVREIGSPNPRWDAIKQRYVINKKGK